MLRRTGLGRTASLDLAVHRPVLPCAEGSAGLTPDRFVIAVTDGNQRGDRRANHPRVKRLDILDRHRGQRLFGADRGMAVGMGAVDQVQKRTVGDGARHVAKLRQPVQTELAHTGHVGFAQGRP